MARTHSNRRESILPASRDILLSGVESDVYLVLLLMAKDRAALRFQTADQFWQEVLDHNDEIFNTLQNLRADYQDLTDSHNRLAAANNKLILENI